MMEKRQTVYGVRSFAHLGDAIITAGAVRNVRAARPDLRFRYVGWAAEVWANNPDNDAAEATVVLPKVHYGSVEDERRASFGTVVEGFTRTLCRHLGISPVRCVTRAPFAVLSAEEKAEGEKWRGCVLLNANGQTVSFSKAYPHWQRVVDGLAGDFRIVQVGSREKRNISTDLRGVEDMRGRTENLRQFMAMVWGCAGVISPPSGIVNVAAAFGKPGVVVCGARELPALTAYKGMTHVFRPWDRCASGRGRCCISLTDGGQRPCADVVRCNGGRFAACMAAVAAEEVVAAVRGMWKDR
jgi:hypothetical protein